MTWDAVGKMVGRPLRRDGTKTRVLGASVLAIALTMAVSLPVGAYVRQRSVERVSVKSNGGQSADDSGRDCWSVDPSSISATGRYIAFTSNGRLTNADTNSTTDVYVHDRTRGRTELVSVTSRGLIALPGVGPSGCNLLGSYGPDIAANGRFVAFWSESVDLVPGDTNRLPDVFVRDRLNGVTERISVGPGGAQANGHSSGNVAISDGGRYVVFQSTASNLTAKPLPCGGLLGTDIRLGGCSWRTIFIHDRRTGKTQIASRGLGGVMANGDSSEAHISGNGRFVVFQSTASNLTVNDNSSCPRGLSPTSTCLDVFVFDRQSRKIELMSVTREDTPGNAMSLVADSQGVVSRDGRFVTFYSNASDLVPNDPAGTDAFVRDRIENVTERVSVTSAGEAMSSGVWASISPDARFVAFAGRTDSANEACASLPCTGVWIHDRKTGATEAVDVTPERNGIVNYQFPGPSAGGRFVVFNSDGDEHVARDTNDAWDVFTVSRGSILGIGRVRATGESSRSGSGFDADGTIRIADDPTDAASPRAAGEITGVTIAHRPAEHDLYVRIDLAHMSAPMGIVAPPAAPVTPLLVYGLELEVDGKHYQLRIGDPSGTRFGLFECGPVCIEARRLRGGYGTAGSSVVAAIPLDALGLAEGGVVHGLRAYSAIGSYEAGPAQRVDEAAPTD